jgi:hypothetical protein
MNVEGTLALACRIVTGGSIATALVSEDTEVRALVQRMTQTADIIRLSQAADGAPRRTAVRALSEAALTEDPLLRRYLAGIVMSATEENDNAHWLALVSRLTPAHIVWHYRLYQSVVSFVRDEPDDPGNWRGTMSRAIDAVDTSFVVALIQETEDPPHLMSGYTIFEHLLHEDLARIDMSHPSFEFEAHFSMTTRGIAFFAAAVGFTSGELDDLCLAHPNDLILSSSFPPLPVFSSRRDNEQASAPNAI